MDDGIIVLRVPSKRIKALMRSRLKSAFANSEAYPQAIIDERIEVIESVL